MKKFTTKIREWVHTIRKYMEEEPLAAITILCAYVGDEVAYEFFCSDIPKDRAVRYAVVGEAMRYDDDVFFAAEICGVLEDAVPRFIKKALEDFGIWYHLLDGTDCILSEGRVAKFLPNLERYIANGFLTQWQKRQLNEDNWNINFAGLMAEYATYF